MSTDQSVLEELKDAHPVVAPILDYRFYTKLLGTYVDAHCRTHVSAATGRVHTSLSQVTAATGPLVEHRTQPAEHTGEGRRGRPPHALRLSRHKGKKLLSLDYSQIELQHSRPRTAEDANLIAAYQNDEDIHDRAAYMLFRSRFDPEKKGEFDGSCARRCL
jgi:DNA polymerase-1